MIKQSDRALKSGPAARFTRSSRKCVRLTRCCLDRSSFVAHSFSEEGANGARWHDRFRKPHFSVLEVNRPGRREEYASILVRGIHPDHSLFIANTIRRKLLSDVPGVAINAAWIHGVFHEFGKVLGVYEPVYDILLNLKELVFKSDYPFPGLQLASIDLGHGKRHVTAADLMLPRGVHVVDSDQHICTLMSSQSDFHMKMVLSRGMKVDSAQHFADSPHAPLAIQAVYSPVVRVSYTIQSADMVSDDLIFEIRTNGAVTPVASFEYAIHTAGSLFDCCL